VIRGDIEGNMSSIIHVIEELGKDDKMPRSETRQFNQLDSLYFSVL
jgi:hypothetical protein